MSWRATATFRTPFGPCRRSTQSKRRSSRYARPRGRPACEMCPVLVALTHPHLLQRSLAQSKRHAKRATERIKILERRLEELMGAVGGVCGFPSSVLGKALLLCSHFVFPWLPLGHTARPQAVVSEIDPGSGSRLEVSWPVAKARGPRGPRAKMQCNVYYYGDPVLPEGGLFFLVFVARPARGFHLSRHTTLVAITRGPA